MPPTSDAAAMAYATCVAPGGMRSMVAADGMRYRRSHKHIHSRARQHRPATMRCPMQTLAMQPTRAVCVEVLCSRGMVHTRVGQMLANFKTEVPLRRAPQQTTQQHTPAARTRACGLIPRIQHVAHIILWLSQRCARRHGRR